MLHPWVERGWGSIKVRHHRQEAGNGQPWWSWCPSYENPALNIKVLLKATGNYVPYPVMNHSGKNVKKNALYVCVCVCVCVCTKSLQSCPAL